MRKAVLEQVAYSPVYATLHTDQSVLQHYGDRADNPDIWVFMGKTNPSDPADTARVLSSAIEGGRASLFDAVCASSV